uniref:Uncharacterized protein n=1 Tax=Rhizophora mucronata TaxID=61149 RepID=A0A2P2JJU8_RHIMU
MYYFRIIFRLDINFSCFKFKSVR